MSAITVKADTRKLDKRVKRMKSTMEKMSDLASLGARWHAYYAMAYTLPVGGMNGAIKFNKMEKRINSDAKKAFFTKEDQNWEWRAAKLIKDTIGPQESGRFIKRVKDQERAGPDTDLTDNPETYLKNLNIPKSINEKDYAALRKSKGITSLPAPTKITPLAMVNPQRRANFVNKLKRTMGLAKAGWYACAKNITGGKTANLKGMKWPKELGKPLNKFGRGIGITRLSVSKGKFGWAITNKVRYASEAFLDSYRDNINQRTKTQLRKVTELRFKHGFK